MSSDFVLPIIPVVVGETIEPFKEDKEIAVRSVLLVERDGDTNFYIKMAIKIDMMKEIN